MVTTVVSDQSFEALEKKWTPLMHKFAHKWCAFNNGLEYEDVMQELRLVLYNVMQKYEDGKGASFTTYLWRAFRYKVGNLAWGNTMVKHRVPPAAMVSIDLPGNEVEDNRNETTLMDSFTGLSERATLVGLYFAAGETKQTLMRDYSFTKEDVEKAKQELRTAYGARLKVE